MDPNDQFCENFLQIQTLKITADHPGVPCDFSNHAAYLPTGWLLWSMRLSHLGLNLLLSHRDTRRGQPRGGDRLGRSRSTHPCLGSSSHSPRRCSGRQDLSHCRRQCTRLCRSESSDQTGVLKGQRDRDTVSPGSTDPEGPVQSPQAQIAGIGPSDFSPQVTSFTEVALKMLLT